jgi:hypothetical protein
MASGERSEAERVLLAVAGVEGVGEGRDPHGDPAWVVYVSDRATIGRLPARLAGRAVLAEVTGPIRALSTE